MRSKTTITALLLVALTISTPLQAGTPSNDTVTQCMVNPLTGSLSACSPTGSGFIGPAGDVGFLIQ